MKVVTGQGYVFILNVGLEVIHIHLFVVFPLKIADKQKKLLQYVKRGETLCATAIPEYKQSILVLKVPLPRYRPDVKIDSFRCGGHAQSSMVKASGVPGFRSRISQPDLL
jgi:hypothetical protein